MGLNRNFSCKNLAGDLCALLRGVRCLFAFYGLLIMTVGAQELPPKADTSPVAAPAQEDLSLAASKVDVNPIARDEEIRQRLLAVLVATEWFSDPQKTSHP